MTTEYTGLSLRNVEEKLNQMDKEFQDVKGRYSGFIGRLRKNIKEKDKETLEGCIITLLRLGDEHSVQEQLGKMEDVRDALHYRIGKLFEQISEYLTHFKNTGVRRVEGFSVD